MNAVRSTSRDATMTRKGSRRINRTLAGIALLLSATVGFTGCADDTGLSDEELLGAATVAILTQPSGWQKIEPGADSISIPVQGSTTRTFSYTPGCSARPGTTSQYAFFVKPGDSNLLIHFMGGGACWDADNCTGSTETGTYIPELSVIASLDREIVASRVATGILSSTNTANPVSTYTKVYIPYCTGDIHWGAKDTTYTDPVTGNPTTIQHRGFHNFLAVLKYLQSNYPSSQLGKVVVTGQSAGGYGAVFNFPYIKETYRSNSTYLIVDAAAGVQSSSSQSQSIANWGAGPNAPDWITGISSGGLSSITAGAFIRAVADHYSTTQVAQLTTAYDGAQRYFYNVGLLIDSNKSYVASSSMWGNSNGYDVADSNSCAWKSTMESYRSTAAGAANYRSFTAPGDLHVLTIGSRFFETTGSDSVVLSDWINLMISGSGSWTSKNCTSCSPPVTAQSSPSTLSCP